MTEEDEQLELECDEAQELLMPLQRESVGDGGAGEPEEHEQLGARSEGAPRAWWHTRWDGGGWRRMPADGKCVSHCPCVHPIEALHAPIFIAEAARVAIRWIGVYMNRERKGCHIHSELVRALLPLLCPATL